ncbi:hypothetical protein K440DRAFT_638958 [Wilcoxina mikolae CBS 423.85]|nr:hypothetical protein K440DRAFT_638958 [Wilcoxina mikolae CBS 423.85]
MYPSPILTHEFPQPLQAQIRMQRELTTQLATFSDQLTELTELAAASPGVINTDKEKELWTGLREIKMKSKELEDGLQSLKKQRALEEVPKEVVRYCTDGLEDLGKAVERQGERLREFLESLRAPVQGV